MPELSLSSANADRVKTDAVVVGLVVSSGQLAVAEGGQAVEAAMGRGFVAGLQAMGAETKPGSVTKVPAGTSLRAPVLVLVGLGEAPANRRDPVDPETLRRAAGAAARSLAGCASAAFALPASDPRSAGAVAEGALLGAYDFRTYKTGEGTPPLASVTVLTTLARDKAVTSAVERARHVATSVNLARDWVNTPPNDLTPETFADRARELAGDAGLSVDVLDEPALRAGGYGGILAVGQGSVHPPRLVRVGYRPKGKRVARIALVGKGITFDSGGLSLKPTDGMVTMKCDMAGAAAVVAAAAAVARLKLPVEVIAYAALAENMPSGDAQRPSDVYRAYGGKTVEVLNTDAEGRLVLADGLVRAQEDEPDVLVDVATLTGAMMVALGARMSGIMSNDEALGDALRTASVEAGEPMWPMPLPGDLREKLDSTVADIANIGDRWGGGLQAGLFLQEFVPQEQRWAHLDIAGAAFHEAAPYGYTPKGGTGVAVRTLVGLAEAAGDGLLSRHR